MTADNLFNEGIVDDFTKMNQAKYKQGLSDALEIIDGMVEDNSTIQAWNFTAKRAANHIRQMVVDCGT